MSVLLKNDFSLNLLARRFGGCSADYTGLMPGCEISFAIVKCDAQ